MYIDNTKDYLDLASVNNKMGKLRRSGSISHSGGMSKLSKRNSIMGFSAI